MANEKVSLITQGPYVSFSMAPHESLFLLSYLSVSCLSFGIGVGYTGQWVGKAHNIKTSRVYNRHQVWRNGQPFRRQIK